MKKKVVKNKIKNLWEQRTSEQFRNWPESDKICNFTRSKEGRHMPKHLIKTGLQPISEPPPINFDPWERYFIPQIGIAEHTKGYYHSRNNKDFIDALIVTKGVLGVKSDSGKSKIVKNEMLVIPPNNLCDSFVSSVNTTLYWMHFKANSFWKSRVGEKIRVIKSENFPQIVSLMDAYKCEIFSKSPNYEIIKSIANSIGECILRLFPIEQTKANLTISEILKEVRKYPERKWESCEIADKLGISQPTLNSRCRKINGLSFSATVCEIRMKNAMKMAQSGASNAEIAKKIGYANAYSLAKTFRNKFGAYPASFKKKL